MYGTIGHLRVKSGMEGQFSAFMQEHREKDPGEVALYIYRMDADPNVYYMVAIFESKEAYMANADRPETGERFQQILTYLDGEPAWHDGEIVFPF